MNELKELLQEIENTYNKVIPNDEKHNILLSLWSKYYILRQKLGMELEDYYNVILLFDSECYKIDEGPKMDIPNNDLITYCLNDLKYALQSGSGISEEEVSKILDYVVYYTRKNFSYLGININKNSLNGLCELGQSLSIRPLEKLGLAVTKNLAEDDFNYFGHHAFGTVTFPVNVENNIVNKTYLIDTTYRQFFSSTKCHEGMYYIKDEDSLYYKKPDPGYFVENEEFARRLMREGYIELTNENACLYGIPFALSGYKDATSIDYYNNILNDKNNYVLSKRELEGLNVSFPEGKGKYRI